VNEPMIFDIYILLKQRGKFIHYIREGDEFESERYNRLKDMKIKQLFIKSDDEDKYQAYIDKKLDAAINDDNISTDERAEIITQVTSEAIEHLRVDPTSEKAFKEIDRAGKSMVEVIKKRPEVLKSLFNADNDDDITLTSAINTCTLCIRIGRLLGFDDGLLETMGTGALLRDIGVQGMEEKDKDLFKKPYADFTDDDWTIYKQHPGMSVEMLKKIENENITTLVINIVQNHEEKPNGKGFPSGTNQLTIQDQLVSLVSTYDRNVTCLGMSARDSVIEILREGAYEKKHVNMLQQVLFSIGAIKN
jgi:HD-GYP domain-containing protein (c-di-GMP phosphodiesterase class II)